MTQNSNGLIHTGMTDDGFAAFSEQRTFFQLTGIYPIGTVVYQDIDGYTEQVLMSNAEAGKQLIHCFGAHYNEMYRIEYRDNMNRETSLPMYDQADAEAVYIGL